MGLLWAIISWIIIGAIIGLIARAIMPGRQAMGLGATIVLGVVGAIVGGFIGGLFGGNGVAGIINNPWSIGTIILAVIGALIVMFVYGLITKNSAGDRNTAR
ncbi:GlsB/YeaQ/YmgE family stress response membrane protein [Helcobacillus massiliensis]|uniref:Putative membrane protein YeaQ/YmgE (Transglycosylase-associated protein family) n=1 Tax=Helcobacillus massiliensis TaxID=521392 RepID=A0A839QUV6_9MICO|nr:MULTISPECIES: GlsB/YeaQ/YmgE family stress response membrane protein [Helcobacillus]MBB3023862.1 putative membrane protein YeaQ/YmgE (transglycosylase-associated protein family) [Helcobacillus massiliensis]MCG7427287.1 GlsB/YeaQ/YmgE family stress response membrane protein [Helcobacillus sp. ACRRO]MCT1556528.1 GlsB/YeaQ/YmgE family stress response membrane protein [Helcobacillus massiliensis]MCT2035722.1 GlsB/YeaQ/YmgE family stress response membrane protein [Helcobacillus massiliensis]MCT2